MLGDFYRCERCDTKKQPMQVFFDYCALCGKNLCDRCMAKGCCKRIPAVSGMQTDYGEDAQEEPAHDLGSTTNH